MKHTFKTVLIALLLSGTASGTATVAKDDHSAELKKGCLEKKLPKSCFDYAAVLQNKGHLEKSQEIYQVQCDHGSGEGCFKVARLYELRGKPTKALGIYKRICNEDVQYTGESCFRVAQLAESISQNARAKYWRTKACKKGYKKGCAK